MPLKGQDSGSDSAEGRKSGLFYGWWVVGGCFILLFLFAGAGFYSFSIFIRPLEAYFGWSRASISLAMSIYMLVQGLFAPLVGRLTQAYGPKKIMSTSALCAGVSFAMVSLTDSLWSFYLTYALLSLTTAGIGFIPVSSLLTRWFVRMRGTAIGFSMVGIAMGGFVMSPVVGYITSTFDWRASFVFIGALVWLLGLPVTLFVIKASPAEIGSVPDGNFRATAVPGREEGTTVPRGPDLALEGWPLREAVRTPAFRWIMVTFFLAPLAMMGVLQHQVPLIIDAGIAEGAAAAAMGLTAGLGGLGKLGFGRMADLLPFRYAAILCFGLQALAVLILLNAHTTVAVWAYVVVFGVSMGGVVVLLTVAVGQFFGIVSFGVLLGLVSMGQALGNSAGAVLSGLVYDFLGSYRFVLLASVGIYALAIVAIVMAGKPQPFRKEAR